MKKSLLIFAILLICGSSFAQPFKWSSILYNHTSGPVSPEYQYIYSILINYDGSGKLSYTKSGTATDYDFNVGKKGMSRLNWALNNSQVFVVPVDDMKSDQTLMGGQVRNATITMWQAADLDAKPQTFVIPNQVNDTYAAGVDDLYDTMENLVPNSVWDQAMGQ